MPVPIHYPANYAPGVAMSYANQTGQAVVVSTASPLPVVMSSASSGGPTVLAGNTSANLLTAALVASPGPLTLALSGTWAGSVRLLRSTDGGTTKLPLTIAGAEWGRFRANVCEPVWEESESSARFYLDIVLSSGTLTYRLAQ
ncbi:MAG: hypothetical protein ABW194_01095 [Novosphingobium sp.]